MSDYEIATPDQRLILLAKLFKSRNQEYGSTYLKHGKVLLSIFDGKIPEITNEMDAARMGCVNMLVSKICRYAQNWEYGHSDSLDDMSVYAQMLQHIDELNK